MKEKIAEMYAQALIDDIAPNVFADQVLRLFIVSGLLLTEFCKCDEPDRELGYTYCHRCHNHVSNERMNELIKDDD